MLEKIYEGITKKQPRVTVYIVTKDREKLLKKAVDSVLNQTYKNIELIIVDDCSSDGTRDYLNEIKEKHKNVKVILNKKNEGACYSRNIAIKNSEGEFITGLDDDDYFLPNRVEAFWDNYDHSYSFICSGWKVEPNSLWSKLKHLIKYKYGVICLNDLLDMNHIGNQIFIHKSRLLNVGLFDVEQKAWQDYDLWVRLIKEYGPAYKLRKATQVMNVDRSRQRITTNNNKYLGIALFLKKYKNLMNTKQYKRNTELLRKANVR